MKIEISNEVKQELKKINEFFEMHALDSDVISSHWREYGNRTSISFDDDFSFANIRAEGFDDWQENNFINRIKNIPKTFYLKKNLYHLLPSRLIDSVREVVKLQKRLLSFNCVKQGLCLNAIESSGLCLNDKKIAIIGDGNGFMGLLLKNLFPNIKIVQINLTKVLMFDLLFTSHVPRKNTLNVVLKKGDYLKEADFNFVPAEIVFNINFDDVDFFINIASMQEMDADIVDSYFNLIRNQNVDKTHFYCCNRVSKKLPDGTMSVFDKYAWLESDKVLFDEVCDWYSEFPISRPPFVKKFDGMHKHRLIEI